MAVPAAAHAHGARRSPRHRRVFQGALVALAVLAWLALWAISASPYARYLDHGDFTSSGPAAWLCSAVPGGDWLVPALVTSAGWLLMITAMMLPTTLPLVDTFDRMTRARSDHARLLALLVAGYGAAWSAFGLLAHAAHGALLGVLERWPALAFNAWIVGAATLALAGAFQFSRLKYRCLEKCRTPLSFVIEHWRGDAPERRAFGLGAHHGLYCIGCCWALMATMFVVGMGSLGWMLLIGAAMAAEKNLPWGRRLKAPLGIALLGAAAALVAVHGGGFGAVG